MSIYQKLKSAHALAQEQGKFLLTEVTINPAKRCLMIIVAIDDDSGLTGVQVSQSYFDIFKGYPEENDWLNLAPFIELTLLQYEPPHHMRIDGIIAVSGVLVDPRHLSQRLKDALERAAGEAFPSI